MKQLFLFALVFGLISCSDNRPKHTSTSDIDTENTNGMKTMIPVQTCYIGSMGRDSVFLKTERFPNVVTGTLEYRFYEKDQNTGEFDGKMNGDTLVADYTFLSEGSKSVRQVIFLLQGDSATEGYGETEEKNGRIVFKNLNEIKFDDSFQLHKIVCH